METEKKPKRPRIGAGFISQPNELSENDTRYEKVNYLGEGSSSYNPAERMQNRSQYGDERHYQPRQYGYNRQNGYNNRGYNQRPYNNQMPPSAENTDTDNTASDIESTQEQSYRPRQNQGYQPRNYNNNRQGGYNNRGYNNYRQNGEQGEGGYQPHRNNYNNRGYNNYRQNGEQNEGGYQPRRNNYNNRGYNNYRQNGEQNEGGYQPRHNNYNNRGYNNNRQGGYNNRQGNHYGNQQQHGGGGYMKTQGMRFTPRPKPIDYVIDDIDPNEPIRLNKFMANAGVCSRREADEHIAAGLVKVNGEVVTELGTKISRTDVVEYGDKVVTPERKCYVLLNKPKDCVTTSDDPNGRTTVLDLVKNACQERIYPVGRLDRNTTGVLLLTNDGDLASKLTHPKYEKKKIYHVWTNKDISEEDMQRIADGIELEDGEIHADAISYVSDTERNQAGIEIHTGRNRIVRRIFESLGYRVIKLDRVYFAGLTKKNLPRGRWRYLTQEEVNYLRQGSFE